MGPQRSTPLDCFLTFLREEGVMDVLDVRLFVANSRVWLPQTRRRLYILFMALDCGGARCGALAERLVKARA